MADDKIKDMAVPDMFKRLERIRDKQYNLLLTLQLTRRAIQRDITHYTMKGDTANMSLWQAELGKIIPQIEVSEKMITTIEDAIKEEKQKG